MSSPSSSAQHHQEAEGQGPVTLALVTVSDTRTLDTDENARYLQDKILAAGHAVSAYHIVKDDPAEVLEVLESCTASNAQVVLFNGGTGIARRDRTFDVLSGKLEKTLPGFGEIFRFLSYKEVGPAAMLSRAVAGVYRDKVILSVPGSPNAVELAWEKLIEPELKHLAWELTR